jgi:SulP family sulfate permease
MRGDAKPATTLLPPDIGVAAGALRAVRLCGRGARVGAVPERIADRPKTFVPDFSDVPFLDSTAAHAIEAAIMKANRSGVRVLLTGTTHGVRHVLWARGVRPPKVRFKNSIEEALASAGR